MNSTVSLMVFKNRHTDITLFRDSFMWQMSKKSKGVGHKSFRMGVREQGQGTVLRRGMNLGRDTGDLSVCHVLFLNLVVTCSFSSDCYSLNST